MNLLISLILLFNLSVTNPTGLNGSSVAKIYDNFQTSQTLDLFFIVHTSSRNLGAQEYTQLKTALSNMIENIGSGSVRIGIIYYGSLQILEILHVPSRTKEAIARIKTKIEQKQYHPTTVDNPSTLEMALAEVTRMCNTSCRDIFVPRVTVVITSEALPSVNKEQMTQFNVLSRMTVLAVGVGQNSAPSALHAIASEPIAYTMTYPNFAALITSAQSISSIVSAIPPLLQYTDSVPPKQYTSDYLDLYNTVQYLIVDQKAQLAVIEFETDACCSDVSVIKVFTSTKDTFPTSDNNKEVQSYTMESCQTKLRLKYYVLLKQPATRLYIGFVVKNQAQTIKYKLWMIDFDLMSSGASSRSLPTECSNYTMINDSSRNIAYSNFVGCDNLVFNSSPSWIRFVGEGGTMLPTNATTSGRCGSHASGWYNSQLPSLAGDTVNGTVCFSWGTNTCRWSKLISVTHCESYYVYLLTEPPGCSMRYCTAS